MAEGQLIVARRTFQRFNRDTVPASFARSQESPVPLGVSATPKGTAGGVSAGLPGAGETL